MAEVAPSEDHNFSTVGDPAKHANQGLKVACMGNAEHLASSDVDFHGVRSLTIHTNHHVYLTTSSQTSWYGHVDLVKANKVALRPYIECWRVNSAYPDIHR